MMRVSTGLRPAEARPAPLRTRAVPHVVVVLLGFALATTSFVAASIFADSRLERVAERMHVVSDNAMPSLVQLGNIRRELADVRLALDEAAEGGGLDRTELDGHLRELRNATATYAALPKFPGEPEVWARTSLRMDDVSRAVERAVAALQAGDPVADAIVEHELVPAMKEADAGLVQLRAINVDQGKLAAAQADHAWARTRRVTLALDAICAVLTAGLAWLAYRTARSYAAAEARRADELDGFAARVAHDIRGPLTAPMFALQRLSRDLDEGSPQKKAADRGVRSLQRVDDMIRDLLTFARAAVAGPDEGGRSSLRAVVVGVVQDAEQEAAAAGVRIETSELPACQVACAPGVLTSIVGNLVANAIKYMPPEAAQRSVTIRGGMGRGRVRVEVADTGAGLPAEVQERIFEPYVRADGRMPGLGLGLATVKRLVEAHGGRVGVSSRVGSGSVFWFEMPAYAT